MQPAIGKNIEHGLSGISKAVPCFWCAGHDRQLITLRGDKVPIMQCRSCGHRAVEQVTMDLDEVYQSEEYFLKATKEEVDTANQGNFGYANYQQISFADWNAEFFSALFLMNDLGTRSDTLSVLDIGCATGTFLDMIRAFGYKSLGVEPSLWAQKKCIEKGHRIVADAIEELDAINTNVDLITAFHVLEHLTDLSVFFDSVAECIKNGSKLLAVFPNVNFQQENWSGKHDSFEHISYFSEDFVTREFRKRLPQPVEVLYGPDLVFCFAGNLSGGQQNAIAAVREIGAKFADADILDNCNFVDKQDQLDWLHKRLASLTLPGLIFVVNFLARNHSSSLGKRVLEATSKLPQWEEQPAWLALCYGLVHRQNGNIYGAATYLAEANPKGHQDYSINGISYLRKLVQDELPRLLLKSTSNRFPTISVWVNDAEFSEDSNVLFRSIGDQTYPYIQVLILSNKNSRGVATISEAYRKLVSVVETADRTNSDVWQEASGKSLGEIVLLTNGKYILSEHCLFAMYYRLISNPDSVVTVKVRDSLAEPAKRFLGQRLIEKIFGKRFTRQPDSSFAPPFVMFNRKRVLWADVDLSMVGDPVRFKKHLLGQTVIVCPEVLGWLRN